MTRWLKGWLRDFGGAHTAADLASAREKVAAEKRPGAVVWLTHREFEALIAGDRERVLACWAIERLVEGR